MNPKPASIQLDPTAPMAAVGRHFDATDVDPRPDARARLVHDRAQVDFGDDNLLFNQPESAAMPLDPGSDLGPDLSQGLDLVLEGAPAAKPAHSSHVGRYRLRECLGEGRSGRLYAAWDPMFSRALVLKLLHPGEPGLSSLQRATQDALTLRQARAVSGLNHSGIVRVFDVGSSTQGIFLTMARPAGCDLRQLLAEGWRSDAANAAKLVRRLADALAYAHGNGVLHGQIQPAHIFMRDRRRPKLLDFMLSARTSPAARLTATAPDPVRLAHCGTDLHPLHYRSPEQLRGAAPDARSDVYALGVVLYELLAGVRAFEGSSTGALVQAVLQQPVPPAHSVSPGVPPELSLIAARAMARMPAQRYSSARALADALRAWTARLERDSPPLAFAPPGVRTSTAPIARQRPARAWPWFARWRGALAATAAVRSSPHRPQDPSAAWARLRCNPAMPVLGVLALAALITALLALG